MVIYEEAAPINEKIQKAAKNFNAEDTNYAAVRKAADAAKDYAAALKKETIEEIKTPQLRAYMEKHNGMGKLAGAATGAGIGVAAGATATLITSFIEKNNINCRIGDDLERISYGKTGKIDSLKDFYVKWNLSLPDTIMPTALVVDCTSWQNACGTIRDMNQCAQAQVNYKPSGAARVTLVDSACAVSGATCIENQTVAASQGACQYAGGSGSGGGSGGGHGGGHSGDGRDRPQRYAWEGEFGWE
jgi:hypothetical protein